MNNGAISGNTALGGGGVYVASGTFIMTGGVISENTGNANFSSGGGGVYMASGTFTMSGGTISGNTATSRYGNGVGGGVFVNSNSTFTMNNGSISGNTATWKGDSYESGGGGVYIRGTFTKSGTGGIIYGSNAPDEQANKARDDSSGHAVSANGKKRNTTARATTAMDSRKDGPAGGWE